MLGFRSNLFRVIGNYRSESRLASNFWLPHPHPKKWDEIDDFWSANWISVRFQVKPRLLGNDISAASFKRNSNKKVFQTTQHCLFLWVSLCILYLGRFIVTREKVYVIFLEITRKMSFKRSRQLRKTPPLPSLSPVVPARAKIFVDFGGSATFGR